MFRPYDMHMHTVFSTDSETPMEAQAEAAISRGLAGIAITDHYNPDYPNPVHRTGQPTEAYHRAMEHLAEQYAGRLEVLKGIEMGILPGGTMTRCMISFWPPSTPRRSAPLTIWPGIRPAMLKGYSGSIMSLSCPASGSSRTMTCWPTSTWWTATRPMCPTTACTPM